MELNNYFTYDENSPSYLVNKVTRGVAQAGSPTSASTTSHGYQHISLSGRKILVHRVVWELHRGEIPKGHVVDHIDGNPLNNRLDNLRLATLSQNSMNVRKHRDGNPLLPKGVYEMRPGYLRAKITLDGKVYSKSSKDLTLLTKWLSEKREALHGEFAHD